MHNKTGVTNKLRTVDLHFSRTPKKVQKSTEIRRISVLFMVEISGIEPLTVSALRAETPPAAATIEMQEVSGSAVSCQAKETATFR
ncbi:MAG: hypothetical protein IJQ17_04340 [Oscillospiraceae bacterium]|nr:hypothetical protein [Oscillospiraceae bacterium]